MTDFKILSINDVQKTMIIDWGYVVLNHDIPLYILENPSISKEEMLLHISYMRPPEPINLEVPPLLKELVEPTQGLVSEEQVIPGETLL